NLLDARFHHARLVAAQGAIYLGSSEVTEQCGDDACRCDQRNESKPDSPQDALAPFSHPCLTGIPIGGNHAARSLGGEAAVRGIGGWRGRDLAGCGLKRGSDTLAGAPCVVTGEESFHVGVEHRRYVESQDLREEQAADDSYT